MKLLLGNGGLSNKEVQNHVHHQNNKLKLYVNRKTVIEKLRTKLHQTILSLMHCCIKSVLYFSFHPTMLLTIRQKIPSVRKCSTHELCSLFTLLNYCDVNCWQGCTISAYLLSKCNKLPSVVRKLEERCPAVSVLPNWLPAASKNDCMYFCGTNLVNAWTFCPWRHK